MEQKTLARDFSYRRKERFQIPLGLALGALALALLLPLPPLRWPARRALDASRSPRKATSATRSSARPTDSAAAPGAAGASTPSAAGVSAGAAALALLMVLAASSRAQAPTLASAPTPAPTPAPVERRRGPGVIDELLLRPTRLNQEGRREYAGGNHPQALSAFERGALARPQDPRGLFNLADGLYKNGKFDEAATLFRSLGENESSPLAFPSRFNLGNSLFQKRDYRGAVQSYRDALRLAPDDLDARRNLEMALRALKQEQEQQKKQQKKNDDQKDQKKGEQGNQDQQQSGQRKQEQSEPQTPEQREDQRFRQEAGMPKNRAMQLLDALQQNEKAEQKKLILAKRAQKRGGKDW
jgi:Ca-activated chloride channel homolog